MFRYYEQVKRNVLDFLNSSEFNYLGINEDTTREEFNEIVFDYLWTEDSVTGNGSGSYTMSREEAKMLVLSDFDTVYDAMREFGVDKETVGEKFLQQDWEWFDVSARCFVLGAVVDEFAEAWEELQSSKKMKQFGRDNTHLRLSDKAFTVYSNCDPLKIYEHSDGTYSMRGGFHLDNLTEEEVNEVLEDDYPTLFGEEVNG